MPYLARRVEDGKYYTGRYNKWVDDINKARIFGRKCDLSNSIRSHHQPPYEVIECKLIPTNLNYKVICSVKLYDIKEKVFATKEHAELYRKYLCSKYGIHADYFPIKTSAEKVSGEIEWERPDWQDYLLGLAHVVSRRSHDQQTQHGCVITDREHRILGTGYNGFPRKMNDAALPNTRPLKYPWMLHSEINAIANCVVRPEGGIVYVTGPPCFNCLINMWQNGIAEVIHGNRQSVMLDDTQKKLCETFLKDVPMKITSVTPNLDWLKV